MHALLIRHAEHTLQDQVLVGRTPGVHLTNAGRKHALALGRELAPRSIVLVQSSPRERCRETAEQIATVLGVPVEIAPALDEIDFGVWTGADMASLPANPGWRAWNEQRALVRPPGGESMREAQQRIVMHMERTARCDLPGPIAIVTHAEIIRAALLHMKQLPLEAWNSIAVAPGQIIPVDVPFMAAAA